VTRPGRARWAEADDRAPGVAEGGEPASVGEGADRTQLLPASGHERRGLAVEIVDLDQPEPVRAGAARDRLLVQRDDRHSIVTEDLGVEGAGGGRIGGAEDVAIDGVGGGHGPDGTPGGGGDSRERSPLREPARDVRH
jgi:hypothetical protein